MIAALESCCRLGELLSLTWADIDLTRKELTVRAEKAKTNATRIVPISTRLAGILEMAHTAVETQLKAAHDAPLSADELQRAVARAYVFGDAIGGEVKSIKRAWATAVLKAHGYAPQWTKGNKLAAESRAVLQVLDLHFHDLRHEGGSRLLEAGWPLQFGMSTDDMRIVEGLNRRAASFVALARSLGIDLYMPLQLVPHLNRLGASPQSSCSRNLEKT